MQLKLAGPEAADTAGPTPFASIERVLVARFDGFDQTDALQGTPSAPGLVWCSGIDCERPLHKPLRTSWRRALTCVTRAMTRTVSAIAERAGAPHAAGRRNMPASDA